MNSEAKSFYKSLVTIVGPIALQNLISAAVNSVDVLMLGSVGQSAIAATSLAGQIIFILFMITTGLSSGLVMLSAQYWGKNDTKSIEILTGIALRISATVGLVFSLAALTVPSLLMRIFTDNAALIKLGAGYLRAAGVSYLCMSVSQIFQATFKSIEKVKIVTVLTFLALGINVLLNACFIYGVAGFPKIGVVGVGIATSVSRVIELAVCLVYASRVKEMRLTLGVLAKNNALLTKDFFKYSLPALGNELVWGAAFSVYSVILGHLGEEIVAANSVVNTIRNLATVLVFGMAYGGAIVLGKYMGSGNLAPAERNAARLAKVTIASGFFGALLMLCLKPLLPFIADLNEAAARYREYLTYINAVSVIGCAINTCLICGIFRAGGDSRFGFILDGIIMWFVSVPLGLIAAFVIKLPPVWVYFVLYLDEFEKMPFVVVHYFKKGWLKNITRENLDGQKEIGL